MAEEKPVLHFPYTDNERYTVAARLIAEIAHDPKRLWVASGYFAPSVWAALSGSLDDVADFRLLLGKDFELANLERGREEARIVDLVQQAIRNSTQPPNLVSRAEAESVAALVAFLDRHRESSDEPVVKLWDSDAFLHAKAFLFTGSVGIGSANFTGNGVTRNHELVGWRQDWNVVKEVEDWYLGYWQNERARDYTDELIATLRATPLVSDEYRPYDVLIRALADRYGTEQPPSLDRATFSLSWYQEDAVFRLIRLLSSRAHGALLADAVGLGKTYMALGVIHHFLYTSEGPRRGRGRPVLLVVPKSLEDMWRGVLRDHGYDWACDVLTTQSLRGDFDVRPYQETADLVVIDEAHRLRGGGVWFQKINDLLTGGERAEERRVLLLTATPVNTGMADLVRLLRVLTKNRRGVWAPEIADFQSYLERVERGEADPFPILDRAIVRRSRSDILRAQEDARAAGVPVAAVKLPTRKPAHVDHGYVLGDDDGTALFDTFAHTLRSLVLAPYDLERFRRQDPAEVDQLELHGGDSEVRSAGDEAVAFRPGTLAALAAAGLLVRFQSSLEAIRRSLLRLDAVLQRSADALSSTPPRVLDLQGSSSVKRLLLRDVEGWDQDEGEEAETPLTDPNWETVLAEMPELPDANLYDISAIRAAVERDRALLAELIAALPPADLDGKVAALILALRRPRREDGRGKPSLEGRSVLVFSQFRDTARYVHARLIAEGFDAALVEGSVPAEKRRDITAWFDPARRAAKETLARAQGEGEEAPQILVSTDVLAEGHNLQFADTVVNFDLHFNPQVAVQRAGRVDRLNSPHDLVHLVSFLPPEGIERHIGLLARLDERFRRIHGLGLGDEQVIALDADTQVQTLEQIRRLYADDASVLDEVERSWTLGTTDYMRQPLVAFLQRAGFERIAEIPRGVSSVRRLPNDSPVGPGIFLALGVGTTGDRPTDPPSETYWRYYPRIDNGTYGAAISDDIRIFRSIACRPEEPRAELTWKTPGPTAIDWDLLRRAAEELAHELTLARAMAEVSAGASDRSNKLRQQLKGDLADLEVDGAEALSERLLQVRVEDYDSRTGWRRFSDANLELRRSKTVGERREAAQRAIQFGLELFGPPVDPDTVGLAPVDVLPENIRLVGYEALVPASAKEVPALPIAGRLFLTEGDQLILEPGDEELQN